MSKKTQNPYNYKRNIFRWFCFILISTICILLLLSNSIKVYVASHMDTITNIRKTIIKNKGVYTPKPNYKKADEITWGNLTKGVLTTEELQQTGVVSIPSAGINLPIISYPDSGADSYYELLNGAGATYPTKVVNMDTHGNFVLSSHSLFTNNPTSDLFSNLKNTVLGDYIYTSDGQNIYTYLVKTIKTVLASDTDSIKTTNTDSPTITLYTCEDLAATKRIVVVGTLIKKNSIVDASTVEKIALSKPKNKLNDWDYQSALNFANYYHKK